MQKVPTYLSENACNVKSGDYLSVDIQSKNGIHSLKCIIMEIYLK